MYRKTSGRQNDKNIMKDLDRLKEIENEMNSPTFWNDKGSADKILKEYRELKSGSSDEYKDSCAVFTIIAGVGGDDAEDFARMLFTMYFKFAEKNNAEVCILSKNQNEHGGYKNISFEVKKRGLYNKIKSETGVHRLVRISPFNSKNQRHTSFAFVDVIPLLTKFKTLNIPEEDFRFEFSRSGGAGGQNVNKVETAVRAIHIPTGLSVRVENDRTQLKNKEKAVEILECKINKLLKEKMTSKISDLRGVKQDIVWGNQIRSYVIHPYKLVKDHRTGVENKNPDAVFSGEIECFFS